MAFLLPIAIKIIWWALPKLAGTAIDKLGIHLLYVETADQLIDTAARRKAVLQSIGTQLDPLPESFVRAYVELLVILHRIGVTSASLDAMELIVGSLDVDVLTNPEKRAVALQEFLAAYKDVPESVARLLIEFAVAKIRATVGAN